MQKALYEGQLMMCGKDLNAEKQLYMALGDLLKVVFPKGVLMLPVTCSPGRA